MKRIKKHISFKLFGLHIEISVSTYRYGFKRKQKSVTPKVELLSR